MTRTRADVHLCILRTCQVGGHHATRRVDFARLLIDLYRSRSGAARRVGQHRRTSEVDHVGRANHLRARGGGLAVVLLEANIAGLIERGPLTAGIESRRKFGGSCGLRRCGTNLANNLNAGVAEKLIEMAFTIESRDELLG